MILTKFFQTCLFKGFILVSLSNLLILTFLRVNFVHADQFMQTYLSSPAVMYATPDHLIMQMDTKIFYFHQFCDSPVDTLKILRQICSEIYISLLMDNLCLFSARKFNVEAAEKMLRDVSTIHKLM